MLHLGNRDLDEPERRYFESSAMASLSAAELAYNPDHERDAATLRSGLRLMQEIAAACA